MLTNHFKGCWTNLWIEGELGWVWFVSLDVHSDGGTTTACTAQTEYDTGIVTEQDSDALK